MLAACQRYSTVGARESCRAAPDRTVTSRLDGLVGVLILRGGGRAAGKTTIRIGSKVSMASRLEIDLPTMVHLRQIATEGHAHVVTHDIGAEPARGQRRRARGRA